MTSSRAPGKPPAGGRAGVRAGAAGGRKGTGEKTPAKGGRKPGTASKEAGNAPSPPKGRRKTGRKKSGASWGRGLLVGLIMGVVAFGVTWYAPEITRALVPPEYWVRIPWLVGAQNERPALAASADPTAARTGSRAAGPRALYEENDELERDIKNLDRILYVALGDMNVPEDDVAIVDVTGQRKNEQEWDHVLIDVALPAGLDQDRSIRSLKAALDRAGLKPRPRVQTTRKDSTVRVDVFLGDLHTHTLTLHAAAPKARPEAQGARSPRPQPSPPTPPPPASTAALEPTGPTVPTGPSPSVRPASSDKPRVAIVIDDFGLDASVTQCFLDAGPGLTFSVLPFLPYSEDVARRAHEQGTEVLLHMPMQPNGWPKVQPGEGALLVEMDQADIQARVRAAWRAVPHAVGMNNHMGSRFSADQTRMGWALEALKQEGGFYLDSRTGTRSSGYSVAKRLGIPAAGRTIFLDNDPDPRAVRYQLRKLVAWAKAHGQAVGIGHVHPTTCQVLVSEREYLLGRVELAPISQLVSPKREP